MRIRERMEARGILPIQLADAMSVSPGAVNKWVYGKANPSADKLPALAGLLDTCSVGAAKEDFRTCCRRLGGRLQHVHLADGTPMGHLVPGDGALPLRAYLETLDAIGYRQAIGLEIYNWQYDFEPHLHMERALRTVRAWLAE